jgi:ribosomal protein S27AE
MNELYQCPNCGENGSIMAIMPLIKNIRYDAIGCPSCGAEWRVYYEFAFAEREVMFMPESAEPEAKEKTETNVEEG